MPPAGHCSASLSGRIAQTLLQILSLCIDEWDHEHEHEHGPNVAMKHQSAEKRSLAHRLFPWRVRKLSG